ncbi:uncharacterized protein LOC113225334 isoform X1 [Piliocolobus tephrosceles]|uniref:uncharacterized protein LOC113225334 isoform X1 n=1 Tax=Piliocolobus tephrosceles TaxID=591936 RepID=UPI000E6AE8DB|nr:uncharacterized protein LOC113225334 isoform X1 [Piliocolobus tephrosceles]
MRREGRGLTGEMEMNSKHTHSEESQGSVRGCRWTREPAKTYGPCSHRGLESTPVDLAGPFMVTSRNVVPAAGAPLSLEHSDTCVSHHSWRARASSVDSPSLPRLEATCPRTYLAGMGVGVADAECMLQVDELVTIPTPDLPPPATPTVVKTLHSHMEPSFLKSME